MTRRIACISVHGCPLARLGTRDTGGMSVYVRELSRGLGRLGVAVDVYTRVHDPAEPSVVELGPNARVIHVQGGEPGLGKADLFARLPLFLEGLLAFQRQHGLRYDLVHTHYWLSGWVGLRLAREWGHPLVATFHTLAEVKKRVRVGEQEDERRTAVEREVVARADRVIVSTPHERAALRHLYGAREDKVCVVTPGVDLAMFRPGSRQAARLRLGLNGHRVLLYVGRLEPIKGAEVLLRAVASLEPGEDVCLLVVGGDGEGDERVRDLRRLAQELGIQDRVDFLGSQRHDLLPYFYQAADVCVVPSHYESFGLVALEAMACGTPVVASRVPGLQTIVRDDRSGYLVPWHCPDAYAGRIEVLLANEDLRQSMGREGRSIADALGWERTAARVLEVYRELWGLAPS
ncbi:MAG: glycosyltransferase [Chloroflexi bacterium]|nr:glycosyltransferase [Chloroflexota bacterium]